MHNKTAKNLCALLVLVFGLGYAPTYDDVPYPTRRQTTQRSERGTSLAQKAAEIDPVIAKALQQSLPARKPKAAWGEDAAIPGKLGTKDPKPAVLAEDAPASPVGLNGLPDDVLDLIGSYADQSTPENLLQPFLAGLDGNRLNIKEPLPSSVFSIKIGPTQLDYLLFWCYWDYLTKGFNDPRQPELKILDDLLKYMSLLIEHGDCSLTKGYCSVTIRGELFFSTTGRSHRSLDEYRKYLQSGGRENPRSFRIYIPTKNHQDIKTPEEALRELRKMILHRYRYPWQVVFDQVRASNARNRDTPQPPQSLPATILPPTTAPEPLFRDATSARATEQRFTPPPRSVAPSPTVKFEPPLRRNWKDQLLTESSMVKLEESRFPSIFHCRKSGNLH